MLGRAVNAFRKSVIKPKSSNTISNSERDDGDDRDGDDTCNESIISKQSIKTSCATEIHRRSSLTSTPTSRLSLLRRKRRSQSANCEGEENV